MIVGGIGTPRSMCRRRACGPSPDARRGATRHHLFRLERALDSQYRGSAAVAARCVRCTSRTWCRVESLRLDDARSGRHPPDSANDGWTTRRLPNTYAALSRWPSTVSRRPCRAGRRRLPLTLGGLQCAPGRARAPRTSRPPGPPPRSLRRRSATRRGDLSSRCCLQSLQPLRSSTTPAGHRRRWSIGRGARWRAPEW